LKNGKEVPEATAKAIKKEHGYHTDTNCCLVSMYYEWLVYSCELFFQYKSSLALISA